MYVIAYGHLMGARNIAFSLVLYLKYLHTLPAEIGRLSNLCYLNLRGNGFVHIPVPLHSLKGLVTMDGRFHNDKGLMLDEALLDTLPEEVVTGGTSTILAYLKNEVVWHLQRLIAGGAGSVGIVTAIVLGFRWSSRRYQKKKKG
jgi:hypothetical protein